MVVMCACVCVGGGEGTQPAPLIRWRSGRLYLVAARWQPCHPATVPTATGSGLAGGILARGGGGEGGSGLSQGVQAIRTRRE